MLNYVSKNLFKKFTIPTNKIIKGYWSVDRKTKTEKDVYNNVYIVFTFPDENRINQEKGRVVITFDSKEDNCFKLKG